MSMNLQNIIPVRQTPDEPWSDLEITALFLALLPYVFKIDPRKNIVSFYLPPETTLDPKEMNGLFESWSETIDWLESRAFDSVGMPLTQKVGGVILEAHILRGFALIYEEAVRLKKEQDYSFQKHHRGLEILMYDNYTA